MWEEGGYLGVWVGGSSGIIVCLSGGDPVIRLTVMSVTITQQSQYIAIVSHNAVTMNCHSQLRSVTIVTKFIHSSHSQKGASLSVECKGIPISSNVCMLVCLLFGFKKCNETPKRPNKGPSQSRALLP